MTTQAKTTHVRASKAAVRRIGRLTKKLSADRRGSWSQADVIDEALDVLESKLTEAAEAAKSQPA